MPDLQGTEMVSPQASKHTPSCTVLLWLPEKQCTWTHTLPERVLTHRSYSWYILHKLRKLYKVMAERLTGEADVDERGDIYWF